jgi:TM2 domain-containing membrane protein YozV
MQRLGTGLLIAGLVAVAIGLLGLLSLLLQRLGVAFVFAVTPWYGPFLGGVLLAAFGWFLRRRSGIPARGDAFYEAADVKPPVWENTDG